MTASARSRRVGILLVVASTFAWSTAGLFMRLLAVDVWSILFWRSIFAALFIGIAALWCFREKSLRDTWLLDPLSILATVCSTVGMIAFIPALSMTTVANVAIIYATLPFVASALAWLWLGETPSARILLFAAVAVGGAIGAVGWPSIATSHDIGNILAFAMTLAMAAMTILIRGCHTLPLLSMSCLSNVLCALVIWPFASSLAITPESFSLLALFGLVQMAFGLTLFAAGARLIPAAETALISTIELPLGPLWVWLAFAETPSLRIIVGGMIVMTAVFCYLISERRLSRGTSP